MATGADIDEWLPFSHIVLSNFKRWTLDVFHGVSPVTCRPTSTSTATGSTAAHREDLFRRVLNRCLLYTGPAPYSLLTGT